MADKCAPVAALSAAFAQPVRLLCFTQISNCMQHQPCASVCLRSHQFAEGCMLEVSMTCCVVCMVVRLIGRDVAAGPSPAQQETVGAPVLLPLVCLAMLLSVAGCLPAECCKPVPWYAFQTNWVTGNRDSVCVCAWRVCYVCYVQTANSSSCFLVPFPHCSTHNMPAHSCWARVPACTFLLCLFPLSVCVSIDLRDGATVKRRL